MKRGSTKSIAELVKVMCREEGLETPLNEYRLINAWPKVLGQAVKDMSQALNSTVNTMAVTVTVLAISAAVLLIGTLTVLLVAYKRKTAGRYHSSTNR